MFTKSRGITIARHSYRLVIESVSQTDLTNQRVSHIIVDQVQHEEIRNLDFFQKVIEGIEDVYEHLEGGTE